MKEFGSTVERHRHDRTFPVSSGVSTSRARPPAWQRTGSWAATSDPGPGLELAGPREIGNRKHLLKSEPSALTGQSVTLVRRAWNISPALGTSLEQNPRFRGCFSVPSRSKGNRIIIYRAAMGIEPTSEIWVHAATSRARLYRNGRTKVAASVHCRPPAQIKGSNCTKTGPQPG